MAASYGQQSFGPRPADSPACLLTPLFRPTLVLFIRSLTVFGCVSHFFQLVKRFVTVIKETLRSFSGEPSRNGTRHRRRSPLGERRPGKKLLSVIIL